MPADDFRIAFYRTDFRALMGPVPLDLLTTELANLPLESRILDVRPIIDGGVSVEWASHISVEDRQRVIDAVERFTASSTTSEPFTVAISAPVVSATATPVIALEFETPPLDAGTYQVLWLCEHRLTAPASSTASRALVQVGNIAQRDHCQNDWHRAFNGSATFQRRVGERLRMQAAIAKMGAGAVSAELSSTRFIIDRIG